MSDNWPKVFFQDDIEIEAKELAALVRELTDMLFAWFVAKDMFDINAFWILYIAAHRVAGVILQKGAEDGSGGESPPEEIR